MDGTKYDKGKLRWDLLNTHIQYEVDCYMGFVGENDLMLDIDTLIHNESWALVVVYLLKHGLCKMWQIVEIYTRGAEKYGEYNWQKVANAKARYYSALRRHDKPGNNDEDWGLPHYAHMAWNAIALRWLEKNQQVHEFFVDGNK